MSLFYTRKGDDGKSRVGKKVLSKTCIEIEALGQLDELNSMTGVLKSQRTLQVRLVNKSDLKNILHQVQEDLFIIQSHVANLMLGGSFRVPKFESSKVSEAEKIIDGIERKVPPLKKFVIPGANETSAWLDLLRAKSRNVEREVLKIKDLKLKIDRNIPSYLNRLSSLFFALARSEAGGKEKHPSYK